MNDAVKYFQKNGFQRSKELVEMGFGFCSLEGGLSFHTEQLKQLVESHELIEKHHGLNGARNTLKLLESSLNIGLYHGIEGVEATTEVPRLKQAIADVESCMEVSSESN